MRITVLSCVVTLIATVSCQDRRSNLSKANINSPFEVFVADKMLLQIIPTPGNDSLYGYTWDDSLGTNLLAFSRQENFKPWDVANSNEGGNFSGRLLVFHYTGRNNSLNPLYTYEYMTGECGSPPFLPEFDFISESLAITDLDENNCAEITFMHRHNCASEINPESTKLVMLIEGVKHEISGNQYIEELYPESGKKTFDAKFEKLPPAFKEFASNHWDIFCKSNPNNRKQELQPITKEELLAAQFYGTEPFWNFRFYDSYAEFFRVGEDTIRFAYAVEQHAVENTLGKVLKISAPNEAQVGVFVAESKALITIKRETCSDGMSDTEYSLSFQMHFPEDNSFIEGCGMMPKPPVANAEEMNDLETKLDNLLTTLRKTEADAFYTNDITEHSLYKSNSDFRTFVDQIMAKGYGIQQAEGRYYLYAGEPEEFVDGE